MFENVFRLNPVITITPFEKLPPEHQEKLRPLLEDKEFYGVLQAPREAGLTVKAVNKQLAEFLLKLVEPTPITDLISSLAEGTVEQQRQFIVRLVLDSVLEVRGGDNSFISGVEAVGKVLLPAKHLADASPAVRANVIQQTSMEAVSLAVNSALMQPLELSFFLYNFNRIPVSRRWMKRFPNAHSVSRFLDLLSDGAWPGMPEWVRPGNSKITGDNDYLEAYWRHWRFKDRSYKKNEVSYKVYFSPVPRHLPEVFRIVRDAAAVSEAHAMKIGGVLSAMLRPDKLIVYFKAFAEAHKFAQEMSLQLLTYNCHAVPFSYQVNPENPLVSMGVDPPEEYGGESLSWRLYVTHKLSLAIHGARRTGAAGVMEYLHSYMRMTGIDIVKWKPLSDDWNLEFQLEGMEHERR